MVLYAELSFIYLLTYFAGELCGLLPNCHPTSQQLHFVVELSSGIRDKMVSGSPSVASPSTTSAATAAVPSALVKTENPVDRLKEALSSKSAFEKYYLASIDRIPIP